MKSNLPAALILASSALLIAPVTERVLALNSSPAEQLIASSGVIANATNVGKAIDVAGDVTKAGGGAALIGAASDNSELLWGGLVVVVLGGGAFFALKG